MKRKSWYKPVTSGVYEGVNTLRRARLISLWLVSICLALAAIGVIAVQVQQRMLRSRAERLLADIRALELRKSTFQDAQRVFRDWRRFGLHEGDCHVNHCKYEIALQDFVWTHPRIFGASEWMLNLYEFAGGRATRIRASVTISSGIVWGKSFEVFVDVPRAEENPRYSLIGSARTTAGFPAPGYVLPDLLVHPNYIIGRPGGCHVCLMVYVKFTPFAEPSDVVRLMDFDLSCITRRRPCLEQIDIMPSAWKQKLHEEPNLTPTWGRSECSSKMVALFGRDSEAAAVIEISAVARKNNETTATVRQVEALKPAEKWHPSTERELLIFDGAIAGQQRIALRDRFILFFDEYTDPAGRPAIEAHHCGMVPFDASALRAATIGIKAHSGAADAGVPWF